MQWVGKAVGAAAGFLLGGGIAGSVIGAALGHQFDQGLASVNLREGLLGASRTQALFFRTSFEVMGHIAKSDGRVTESEIQIARRIMHAMRLGADAVRQAIGFYTSGKDAGYPLEARVAALRDAAGGHPDIARAFVDIQLQAALGGGDMGPDKRQLLWAIAQTIGMGRADFAQLEANVRTRLHGAPTSAAVDMETAFRTLGLGVDASDAEVKTAYRRLMNQHHPDKLVARGLPKSMTEVAEQKTREIRKAYDRIRSERGLK